MSEHKYESLTQDVKFFLIGEWGQKTGNQKMWPWCIGSDVGVPEGSDSSKQCNKTQYMYYTVLYYTVLQQCIFLYSLKKSIATIIPTTNPKSESCTQGQNDTILSPHLVCSIKSSRMKLNIVGFILHLHKSRITMVVPLLAVLVNLLMCHLLWWSECHCTEWHVSLHRQYIWVNNTSHHCQPCHRFEAKFNN